MQKGLAIASSGIVVQRRPKNESSVESNFFSGWAQPCPKDFSKVRDDVVIGEVEVLQNKGNQVVTAEVSAIKIQSICRRYLCRSKYLDFKSNALRDLLQVRAAREARSATAVQKLVRGFITRKKFSQLAMDIKAAREAEANKKQTKKGGGKGSAPTPTAMLIDPNLSPKEAALQRNINFVLAYRAALDGKFDDAVRCLEEHLKTRPPGVTDGVASRMIALIQGKPKPVKQHPANSIASPSVQAAVPPSTSDAKKGAPQKKK